MSDLFLYGWRIRTDLPLPELLPWTGDDRVPDIVVRLGSVPPRNDEDRLVTPFLSVGGDGAARFEIAEVAAFLISGGRDIVVEPAVATDAPDIALFLLGSVLGVLCHQRGFLPLHASSLAAGGGAWALAGGSGVGKSTLAAALIDLGQRMLADDVTILDDEGGGRMLALPAFPRQKLWRDALEALDIAPGRRLRSTGAMDKFERLVGSRFQNAALPLRAVCHLVSDPRLTEPLIEKLRGVAALDALMSNTYRRIAGEAIAGSGPLFRRVAAVASQVPQFELRIPHDLDRLDRIAVAVRALLDEALAEPVE